MSVVGVIYKLHSDLCDDFYIGSSINFKARKKRHKENAKKKSSKLYCKMREIGPFWDFTILESDIEYGLLLFREQYYIDKLKPTLNSKRAQILETTDFKYNYDAEKLK